MIIIILDMNLQQEKIYVHPVSPCFIHGNDTLKTFLPPESLTA